MSNLFLANTKVVCPEKFEAPSTFANAVLETFALNSKNYGIWVFWICEFRII